MYQIELNKATPNLGKLLPSMRKALHGVGQQSNPYTDNN